MGADVNGGYRLPLEKMLEGAGIAVQFVGRLDSNSVGMTSPYHDGYSGLRVEEIETGIEGINRPIAEGVRDLQPDVVLILCGSNDIRQNHDLDNAARRLDHLIGAIREAEPQVEVMASSIPPDLHCDDAVRLYNAGIAGAVARRAAAGEKVRFVDNYAVLSSGTDMLPDLTHPNRVGYIKIARNWFRALAPDAPQIAFALTDEGANQLIGEGCLGYQITMKVAAKVTDLGVYCAGQVLTSTHAVGVFDENGCQLAHAEIAPTTVPSGLFAYQKLATPLALEVGRSYFFVSNSVGLPTLKGTQAIVDPLFFDNPRFYFDHNVAVKMTEGGSTILKCPPAEIHDMDGALGYFGPNFRLAP